MPVRKPWIREEIDYIKDNAAVLTDKELCLHINEIYKNNRSFDMVRKMRQRLGIEKAHGRGVCKVSGYTEVSTKVEEKLKKQEATNKYAEHIKRNKKNKNSEPNNNL